MATKYDLMKFLNSMIFKHGIVKIIIKEKKYEQEVPNADVYLAGNFWMNLEPDTMRDLHGAVQKVVDYFKDEYLKEQMLDHITKVRIEQQRRQGIWYWRLHRHLTKYSHLLYAGTIKNFIKKDVTKRTLNKEAPDEGKPHTAP